ncbi:MAG: glycosyltransferase family 2 protein [Gemmatimonadota bacterium]
MNVPLMTVILPTYNRVDRLRRVIAALEQQAFPVTAFDVVVVSDGSSDGTAAYMATLQSPLALQFVEQSNQGAAAARNTGLQHATGTIVLFLDDDVVPSPTLLREHVDAHQQDDLVVLGPMLSPPGFRMQPWVAWEQRMLVKQYDDMQQGRWTPTARQFYTGNSSVQRRWLLEAGGFDAGFRRAEDVELGYRLAARGLRFVFNANAIGWHFAERSFTAWLDTPYQYGRNDVIFTRDKAQHWLLPTLRVEFSARHALIQLLVRACLDRPIIAAPVVLLLRQAAHVAPLSSLAYSSLFNLRHYQGIADELGGRDAFFALGADTTAPRVPATDERRT